MNRWLDCGITLLLLALLGWASWSMLHWLLVAADWSVVATNLPLYAVGSFPADQRWRPLLWMAALITLCLLYTSPSPRDLSTSRMPSSA